MSDKHKQYGNYYSWTILSDSVAVKKTDKSFFVHHGSGIPTEIRWFFDAEHFPDNLRDIPVDLKFDGHSFKGRINLHKVGKVRIFWYADLEKELNKHYEGGNYPLVCFEKTGQGEYSIAFIEEFENDHDEIEPLESVFIPQTEGQKKEYYVTRYERKRENRQNAILIHGTRCMVCGFDFAAFYGKAGAGFIEVHHVKPLHEKDEEAIVNPVTDLVCLCSNCHSMVHRKKNGVYTLDELRKMIEDRNPVQME